MKDLKHMPRNSNLQVKFFHYLEKLLYEYMENFLNAEKKLQFPISRLVR